MIKLITLFTAIVAFTGIIYGVAVGINIAQADDSINPIKVYYSHHPKNVHDVIYGKSLIADNFYSHNGNYDIQYDGNTCFRWLSDSLPVVIAYPKIITYTTPIDDFDLISIIACEA